MSEELKAALARIACLEGEIAKRDETIARLEPQLNRAIQANYDLREELAACRVAVENCELFRARIVELEEKTRTAMGVGSGSGNLFVYGDYDSIKAAQKIVIEREQLRAELAALKAQEPVAELLRGQSAIGTWFDLNVFDQTVPNGTKLYASPVSEAKAQGVVMPEPDIKTGHGYPAYSVAAVTELFARLNASHVQRVSVPDERIIPTSAELIQWAWEEEPEETRFQEGYSAAKRWVKMQIEAGIAAPAAPAADAGLIEALGYQALFDAIAAATSVYANGAVNISVQAFRESLAAHRAKGVV